MAVVMIQAYACERCNYRWSPRDLPVTTKVEMQPKVCPKCKTPFLEPAKNPRHSSRETSNLQGIGFGN